MKKYLCPKCGKRAVIRLDEESVQCKKCGYKTDFYEVLKLEKKD